MKILKDDENNNTVVIYLTGNFCIVKQYLTVISQKLISVNFLSVLKYTYLILKITRYTN